MRTSVLSVVVVCCCTLTCPLASSRAVTVFDDFNDGVIDSTLWLSNTSSTAGTNLEESGGHMVFTRQAQIRTHAHFDTVVIEGVFRIVDSLGEVFAPGTRRNETLSQGIGFVVGSSDNPDWDRFYGGNAYIVVYDESNQRSEPARTSVTVPMNTPTAFKVVDDGFGVEFYVNDMITPILTATSEVATGSQVSFHNRDVANNCVSWLDWVRISPISPPCPAPCGDEVIPGRFPVITWCPATGATWYELAVFREGRPYVRHWIDDTTYAHESGLAAGSYRWWVRPWGPITGMGSWSTGCTFSVDACPLLPTEALTPDGECETGAPITVGWDADSCARYYQVWIERDGREWFTQWYAAGSTSGVVQHTLPARAPFGMYRWWVRGWNPDGLGPWSDPAVFNVGKPSPQVPQGLVSSPVTFTWDDACSARAEWYQIWVRRGGVDYWHQWIRRQETATCGGSNRCYGPVYLPEGDGTWWIRAWGPGGMSSWSDGVEFHGSAP